MEIKVGDIYRDCAYHPVLCTIIDEEEDIIEGKSLADGSEPRSCSFEHCGVVKLTQEEADELVEAFKKDGERGLMRAAGWPDKDIEDFMKQWR